jgi:hypothetical protein
MVTRAAAVALLMASTFTGSVGLPEQAVRVAEASPVAARQAPSDPLEQAHAHNDYEHDRPLSDALEHGFTSVEADVWLVDGELRVAHDLHQTRPGRTLESLYLDPLEERVRDNGDSVYRGGDGTFQLMIDIKSEAESTYAAVHEELAEHGAIMTRFAQGKVVPRPVVAVTGGNQPRATMQAQDFRLAFYDGRPTDLDTGVPASFMPVVSDNWTRQFVWQGIGPMPEAERAKLRDLVTRAHDGGHRLRFWATPDMPGSAREAVWNELYDAGIDHFNTDDLAGLETFLRAREAADEAA